MPNALKTLITISIASAAFCLFLEYCTEAQAGPRSFASPLSISVLDLGSGR